MSVERRPGEPAVTAASVLAGEVLAVAGFPMHVWAADEARAEAVAATLRVALPTTSPPTVKVRFERGAAPPLQWTGDVPFETRRDAPDLTFVRSDLGLVARVTPDQIVVTGDAPDLLLAFRRVFTLAVAHLLGWRDRHVLHAATLGVEQGCILVLGPSGAGKSTLALCALRRGWPVLGDDLVALQTLGEHILATALPRPIAAPHELVDDTDAIRIPGDPRGRLELPPTTVTHGTRQVLGIIVAAHADSPHSTVRELPSFAVLPLVAASSLTADDAESIRAAFPFAATLSRLPTVELAHGTRPGDRLADGARLLEEIHRGFTRAASPSIELQWRLPRPTG